MSLYVGSSMTRLAPRLLRDVPWARHLPFVYDVVGFSRPRLIVDLGEAPEISSFTLCQAVADHGLDALCYTVGAWPEAGEVGEEVPADGSYQVISAYNRRYYLGFSYLLPMPFEQALGHFSDGSVDLLHFDATHSRYSTGQVVTTWLTKVRPGGLLLLHGVKSAPNSVAAPGAHGLFSFDNGDALVVIRKDTPAPKSADPALLRMLFGADGEEQELLRALYAHIAQFLLFDLALHPESFGVMLKHKRVRTG